MSFSAQLQKLLQGVLAERITENINEARGKKILTLKEVSGAIKKSFEEEEADEILIPRPVKTKKQPKEITETKRKVAPKKTAISKKTKIFKKNIFGNIWDPETCFVLDKSRRVCGKQNEDGLIEFLTEEDVEICNKKRFKYDPEKVVRYEEIEDTSENDEKDEILENKDDKDEISDEKDKHLEEKNVMDDSFDELSDKDYSVNELKELMKELEN